MPFVRTALAVGIVSTFALLYGQTSTQPRSRPLSRAALRNFSVNYLQGLTVENHDGRKIGQVSDFILDLHSGYVKYTVLSTGGFLGFVPQLKIVPAQAMSAATAKKGVVALDISVPRWQQAPEFKERALSALNQPAMVKAIYEYYGQSPPNRRGTNVQSGTSTNNDLLTPTGGNFSAPRIPSSDPGALQLASDILGVRVVNRHQEKLGTVSDVLVDLTGRKPTFALVSTGRFLKRGRIFAVPLRALRLAPQRRLLLDAPSSLFEFAPPFDEKAWQEAATASGVAVYRYPEDDVTNTSRNARDRGPNSLTAMSQSESATDRRLTQQIRRALVTDHSLSLTAKNVKIITVNGKITLRGAVRYASEKDEIFRKAAKIGGASNVINQLEVEHP